MNLELINNRKHCITVNSSEVGGMSTLEDIHNTKEILSGYPLWVATDGDFAWLKFNAYNSFEINRIVIEYSGALDSMSISYSYDNINWKDLSSSFVPQDTSLDISYDYVEICFLKITVVNPVSFQIDDLEIYSETEIENTNFISHRIYDLYDQDSMERDPLIPSIAQNILEMYEGNTETDLKIFDSSDFATSSLSKGSVGDVLTLTANNLTITDVPGAYYMFDFDDPMVVNVSRKYDGIIGDEFEGGQADGSVDLFGSILTSVLSSYTDDELIGKILYVNDTTNLNNGFYTITDNTATTVTIDGTFGFAQTAVTFSILNSFSELKTDTDLSSFSANDLDGYFLKIYEGRNAGDYEIASHTILASGNTITITGNFNFPETEIQFQIQNLSDTNAAGSDPNLVITKNPVPSVSHTYTISGTYSPRLIFKHPDYSIEWATTFTKS